ncbi:Per1-like protein [Basidiobolus meristosporus CBS 931.73]|uniref:Post-GPI attachment to proteins factor 3 n=1 Tax=Basidiobolus meristosporus CBS 931.73 TaxID=1314790 RepID=A0A1Y1XTK7_9FUNG|nr:Per1-like protein [Basidiobolus meristosporus CBS 931.73]|eukprot:ORX89107.1 Per1-like protein [Basidiobolus meristosporus CBS 931.73]
MTRAWSTRLLLGLLLLVIPVSAEGYGDTEPEFLACLDRCNGTTCAANPTLPLSLRLTFWSCESNCKYTCMREITQRTREAGQPVVQYYGKWPFVRFLGMQEPASVAFSILNGWAHWRHWKVIKSEVPEGYFLKRFYYMFVVVGVNTWLWSAVFHTRDTPVTEKFDYFSAALTVMYGLYVALLRINHVRDRKNQIRLGGLLLIPYLLHISYLSFWSFDYTYNMWANVIVGILQNITWGYWCVVNPNHPYRWEPLKCGLLISVAVSLELFDFPPIFEVFDAHSLWHASTIFIWFLWYRFMIFDSQWDSMYTTPSMV